MLLHRLFENRLQITKPAINKLISVHIEEYLRLMEVPSADRERRSREFLVAWPFAPHLLRLLEEQVLIATDAQETRDMIRILANLYKSRGEAAPVSAASFSTGALTQSFKFCPRCSSPSLTRIEGCDTCLSCGHSRCG